MATDWFASAFVRVKPDAKGFRTQLRDDVNKAIPKQAFKVPIEFDIKAFRGKIQNELRRTSFKVPLEPDTAGFKRKLNEKLKGLTVTVPVKVVPGDVTQARAATNVAETAATAARTGGGKTATTATKEAAATKKLSDEERARGVILRELEAAQIRYDRALTSTLSAEEKAEALSRAKSAADRVETVFLRQLATAQTAKNAAVIEGIAPLEASILLLQQQTAGSAKAAASEVAAATVRAQSAEAIKRANKALAVNIGVLESRKALAVQDNELSAVSASLKELETAATETNNAALARNIRSIQARIVAQREEIVTQRAAIKAEAQHSRQLRTAGRGAGATGLSLLGVRGATLAANSAFLAGAAAIAVFAKALGAFANFERELNTFRAVAGATADQMERVSKLSLALGADVSLPAVSAADAAQAMTELAKAGLDVEQSMAGARGVLQLAAAAQISNAEAATLTASALNAFSLSGDKAVEVADALANAANAAQGSIEEMGAALQQSSAVARQVGLSLQNTVSLLTLFARNGLRGSDAGTSLRTALLRLVAPTKDASRLIGELGIRIRDAQGNIRPDVFAQFGEATRDLPPALRDMIAETIAGQDAIRAFAIGAREGARGLKLAQLQIEQTGTAAAVASARTKGLAGSFQALGSNAETLGTTLGGFAGGPVKELVDGFNRLLIELNALAEGDFRTFLQETERDFIDLGRDFAATFEGARKVATAFSSDDPLGQIAAGLGDMSRGAKDATEQTEELTEILLSLQKQRIVQFQLRLPIGQITADIEAVRKRLKELGVDSEAAQPLTATEKALSRVRSALNELQRIRKLEIEAGLDPAKTDKAAKELKERLERAAEIQVQIKSEQARLATGNIGPLKVGVDTKEVRKEIKDLRRDMVNELLGLARDSRKALSSQDLAKAFNLTFKTLAAAPESATPEVLQGIRTMLSKIGSTATLSAEQGDKIGKELIKSIQAAIDAAVAEGDAELAETLRAYAARIAVLFGGSLREEFAKIRVPLTSEDISRMILPQRIAVAQAEAFGSVAEQIAAHQAERDRLLKILRGPKKPKGEALEDLLNRIAAEEQAIASLVEQRASDAEEARNKADQAVLDSFSAQEQKIQTQLIIAAGTERLSDDIKFTRALRNLYIRQIAEAGERIKDAQTRNETIATLTQQLERANNDLNDLKREAIEKRFSAEEERANEALAEAQETATLQDDIRATRRLKRLYQQQINNARTRAIDAETRNKIIKDLEDKRAQADRDLQNLRRQQRERFRESIELDIELAQTRENIPAEIRAREALIKALRDEQRRVKRGTAEWKRLRNAIAEEQKAIEDLKKQNEQRRDAARELFFSFLQAQQGFAANLFGNLIPQGATGGLVGNQSPSSSASAAGLPRIPAPEGVLAASGGQAGITRPQDAIDRAAARASAASTAGGMTTGQAATMIKLMSDLVVAVKALNRGSAHPEAKQERQRKATAMDIGV